MSPRSPHDELAKPAPSRPRLVHTSLGPFSANASVLYATRAAEQNISALLPHICTILDAARRVVENFLVDTCFDYTVLTISSLGLRNEAVGLEKAVFKRRRWSVNRQAFCPVREDRCFRLVLPADSIHTSEISCRRNELYTDHIICYAKPNPIFPPVDVDRGHCCPIT